MSEELYAYFSKKFGRVGIEHANDLLKSIEHLPGTHITPALTAIKSDLADIVMLGGSGIGSVTCKDEETPEKPKKKKKKEFFDE